MIKAIYIDLGWWLRYFASTLGLMGIVGTAMLLLAGICYLTQLLPTQAAYQQAKIAQKVLSEVSTAGSTLSVSPAIQLHQQVDQFYQSFLTVQALPSTLAQLNHLANKHQLKLSSADYRWVKTQRKTEGVSVHLSQYQLVMPVNTSYLQLRRFLADVRNSIPTITLQAIELKRESTLSANLEARLVMAIYVREAGK